MNIVTLIGRLTKDIDLRYTNSGTPIALFTIAVDRGLSKEKKQELEAKGQPTVDFINCTAFGKTGEMISNYFGKGGQIGLLGRINTGSYTAEDGSRRYTTNVIIDKFYFVGDSKKSINSKAADYGISNEDIMGESFDEDVPF